MKKVFVLAFAMIMIAMLAIAVSAEVSVTYDLEEVTTTAGPAYRIVGKLTDTEGDFRAWKNDITFDYNMIKPVNTFSATTRLSPRSFSPN